MSRVLYTHGRIYPITRPLIGDGYLLVENGRITDMGGMAYAPVCENTIDVKGLCVYPGFVDAHSHLGMWEDSLGFEGDDGNEETDPGAPQLRAIDAVNVMDRCFREALEAGVTCVVTGPGSANPIAGQFCALKTAGRCIDDMVIRAPAAMKFAFGENPKTVYNGKSQSPATRMATAAIIREQLAKAARYAQDLARANEDDETDPPDYDAKCEALLPLLRGEIPAQMHAHRADDIFTAARIAGEFGFRFVIIHGTQGHEVADLLAARGIRVVTGPLIGSRSKPELASLSPDGPAKLSAAGVETAICTDHPEVPAQYLPLSAALAVQAGMPYEAALRGITITAARLCEIDARVGSLEPGKDADILFYGGDPLTLGEKPRAVLSGGELVSGGF